MNPHQMRELFDDALAFPAPVEPPSTDGIVAAGRRARRRRRRAAQAGAGALAAGAALALAAFPAVFGQGGAAPPAEQDETTSCPAPAAASTEEQAEAAAAYTEVLVDRLSDLGGTLERSCVAGVVDYDGFHYEPDRGGYRLEEAVVFSATGERATLTVDVLDPVLGPPLERMEDLAGCASLEGACAWREGVLLVEEHRSGEGEAGGPFPGLGALTGLGDGTIVHVRMDALGGSGALSTTPEQLGELARALVDEIESSAMEGGSDASAPWSEEELIGDFAEAVSAVLPEAVLASEPPIVFVDPGEDQDYGEDGTAVATASAIVDGQEVELFLQKTPVDSPGDGVGREVAEHYARCDHAAACEFLEVDDSTSRVHRTATRGGTELTSVEFRAGDGWVLGVGVVFGGETAPVDFATLDALVTRIG